MTTDTRVAIVGGGIMGVSLAWHLIRRHESVQAIERDASGAWVVHTGPGAVRTRHVVNAAGTWCREIGAWLLTGSSMGVMEGGGAGRFLAGWMVDGAPPMDALAVDPRRFGGYADRDYLRPQANKADLHGAGGALEVSLLGRRRLARVLDTPPYDPTDSKLRVTT